MTDLPFTDTLAMENLDSHLFQDQNVNIHSAGGARAAKKGALGKRKALNGISNSLKPPALQASKKHNSSNVMTVSECSINEEKEKEGEGEGEGEWEGFLHNHQECECIKAQRMVMDSEYYFLESIGLGAPLVPMQPKKLESPVMHWGMEESDKEPFSHQNWKAQFPDYSLPLYESPKSITCMELEHELWEDDWEYEEFKLIESLPSK